MGTKLRLGWITGAFCVVALATPTVTFAQNDASASRCVRQSSPDAPQPGQPLTKPVEFSVIKEPQPINLENENFEQVVVKANPPLDKATSEKITGAQISLYSAKTPQRVSETLGTAHLDEPRFSEPQIYKGKRISFDVCFDDDSVEAGAYTGEILVSGPEGVAETSVTVILNEKDESQFWIGVVIAIGLALILFTLQALKAARDKLPKSATKPWRKARKALFKDLWFVVPALVGIGAAFVVMWQIFEKDPTWGASKWGATFALVGTGLSAMGISSFLSSLKPKAD